MPSNTGSANLQKIFDRIVCINLKRRPDRWQSFQDRLAAIDWPFIEVEHFLAVDGKQAPSPDWVQCGNGAWGCLQSHIRILEDALTDKVDSLLILEDDAKPVRNFTQRAMKFFTRVPSDWDAILLGGQHLIQPQHVNGQVVRVANGNRTHAHALRGHYIRAAYRHLCDFVDHARHPRHHVDHRLGMLHLSGMYNVYAPTSWMFSQDNGESDICGQQLEERNWGSSIHVTPPSSLLQSEAKQYGSGTVPLVVVLGLYRSGCRPVAGILHALGAYSGRTRSDHFEEPRFRQLCWNFFSEPTLEEHCPPAGRKKLLSDWACFQRLKAKKMGKPFVVAKHPLAALFTKDFKELFHTNLKFIVVERDFSEAVHSLECMNWGWQKDEAIKSQRKLQQAIDSLHKDINYLKIDYRCLLKDPRKEVQRIAKFEVDPISWTANGVA